MNQSILRQFEVLETNKADILQFLREQSEDDLTKKLPEKWTMIQAMRHVQMSENGSLQYMKKKIQAGDDLPTRGLIPRFYLLLLLFVFKIGLKFKAPEVIANPKQTRLNELENDWNQSRNEMKEFLDQFPGKWENRAIYRHPFVGRLNLYDAMRFFNSHLNHHTRQVYRIKKQLRS